MGYTSRWKRPLRGPETRATHEYAWYSSSFFALQLSPWLFSANAQQIIESKIVQTQQRRSWTSSPPVQTHGSLWTITTNSSRETPRVGRNIGIELRVVLYIDRFGDEGLEHAVKARLVEDYQRTWKSTIVCRTQGQTSRKA